MNSKLTILFLTACCVSAMLFGAFELIGASSLKGSLILDEDLIYGLNAKKDDQSESKRESVDKLLDAKELVVSSGIIKDLNLESDEMVYLLENLAYKGSLDSTENGKLKLMTILKTEEASEVLRFLPVTAHYELENSERVELLSSFCRFQKQNENSFENIKLTLGRTSGFKNKSFNLNRICNGAV